ncbi:MAG TPA: NAD-dependent epimerase [Bacteroidales bacterium]|nr:NAD-dependent epimerase [Bacteroidales bacterium]
MILLTGCAGFIGFHLAAELLNRGEALIGFDSLNDYYDISLKYSRLAELGINKTAISDHLPVQSAKYQNFRFIKGNLEDLEFIRTMFSTYSFKKVVHLAAQAGIRHSLNFPREYLNANIIGFYNLLETVADAKIEHFIYASSSSVYGNSNSIPFNEEERNDFPLSMYAASKKTNELLAHAFSTTKGLRTTGLRFFTVYGPWGRPDMTPFLFTDAILKGYPIKLFNEGNLSRDFTYITDIVHGILLVVNTISRNEPFEVFNIGNGKPVELFDFIGELEQALGKKAVIDLLPKQIGELDNTWANTSKFEIAYGFKSSVGINTGITNFVAWYRDFYKI